MTFPDTPKTPPMENRDPGLRDLFPPPAGRLLAGVGLVALLSGGCAETDQIDPPDLLASPLQTGGAPGVGIPVMAQVRSGQALGLDTRLGRHIGPRDAAPTRSSCLRLDQKRDGHRLQFLVLPDDQQAVVHLTLYAESNGGNPCSGEVRENAFVQVTSQPQNRVLDAGASAADTGARQQDIDTRAVD